MQGRWSCFKFFSKVAMCKRALGGETLVRAGMRDRATKHNLDAQQAGRHVVDLDAESDRFLCKNCGKMQGKTVKHITFLAARCEEA